MDQIDKLARALTFNGPLEAGVRAVAILGAAFPACFDIERLTAFDYLLVHTKELGGPDDLHPPTPIKNPVTEVRRKIVQDAINLMMSRNLIARAVDENGIHYCAGEVAATFLDALTTPYGADLKERAYWVVHHFAGYSNEDFNSLMHQFFENWVLEFQVAEKSLGDVQ